MAGKAAKRAKAKAAQKPQPRQGKTRAVPSPAHERPLFCFRHTDRASTQAWAFKPSVEHSQVILTFLCEMAKLTWNEIGQQTVGDHKKHHSQALGSVVGAAQKDAARARLDKTFGDTLFRFRLGNKRRLWGFRTDRVFHVVWWDPDHDVYPTEPN